MVPSDSKSQERFSRDFVIGLTWTDVDFGRKLGG